MLDLAIVSRAMSDGLDALNPPRRVSVSQGATENLVLADAGSYTGPWQPETVPYLIEPMNRLASRHHSAVCFVGPARTGKSAGLILGWLAHAVVNDIGRMMIMHMTEKKAAMLSKLDVDPAIEASDSLRRLKSPRAHDNNIGLKIFRHGMAVRFAHPARSELAGTTYRYVALTDFDRFPDDSNKGGNIFDLAMKRTETLMSRGMTLVESSPERKIEDPHWHPSTNHEAPPCGGILGIYNRSDRRRWYWPCPECGEYFEAAPGLKLFASLPPESELLETIRSADIAAMAAEHARIACPQCGVFIGPEHKSAMNARGVWLADGQSIELDGVIHGDAPGSTIAGYWLGGVAAAYQTWAGMLTRHLQALREYALTGSESTLETVINTDQGMPYLPRHLAEEKAGTRPEDRAEELERYIVQPEARFLIATADVQGGSNGRFIVEVRAFGPHLESWLVDRYAISSTVREGAPAQVDPAGYSEDWDLLTEKVVKATYRLTDGREMRVKLFAVDTGGEAGTSDKAYAWYKRIRKARLAERVILVKGDPKVDSETPVLKGHGHDPKTKRPMRDTPIYRVATNYYKDVVAAALRRKVPGPNFGHFPKWLPASYYSELQAEVRGANGKWVKIRARNEALDLWVYALAACEYLGFGAKLGKYSWDAPPEWARPQDAWNTEIISKEERRAEKKFGAVQPVSPRPAGIARSDWMERL